MAHGFFALSLDFAENLDPKPAPGKATCYAQTNCPILWTSNKFDTFHDLSLVSSLKDAKNGERPNRPRLEDGNMQAHLAQAGDRAPLYTAEQRRRRDSSRWTLVQGLLAPFQFLVFLISLYLVLRALITGQGHEIATLSVVAKTLVLYTIMITGSLWEKDVFGRYLLAPAFFWEDVVSFVVIALHTAYLLVLVTGWLSPQAQLLLALLAYATYVVNAAQFLLKLRAARLAPRPA
jgi:3-vinyl bacteriochlorophyllide hydratase